MCKGAEESGGGQWEGVKDAVSRSGSDVVGVIGQG